MTMSVTIDDSDYDQSSCICIFVSELRAPILIILDVLERNHIFVVVTFSEVR